MKNIKLLFILFSFLFAVITGCDNNITESDHDPEAIVGSGYLVIIEKEFSGFIHIEQHYSFETTIIRSDHYSVAIQFDDNLIHYLSVYQVGDKISLGMKSGKNYKDVTIRAVIKTPDIFSLTLSGGSRSAIYGFDFDHYLNLKLSGASFVEGNINAGNVLFQLSGASQIKMNGTGHDIYVSCSGASRLNLLGYNFNDAYVTLSGASISSLNIYGNLDAQLSGASTLYYMGDATILNLRMSGESRFIRLL
jgi:hypothetical protein